MTAPRMTGRLWALLVVLSLLWGGSFYFIELALSGLPPFVVVFCRVTLASGVLWVVILVRRERVPTGLRAWRDYALLGLFNGALPFSAITFGQTYITAGLASILNATAPLFTVLLAHWLTRDERMTPNRAIGVAIGLGGVVLVVGPDALAGFGGDVVGQFAGLAGALLYAFGGIYGRHFDAYGPLVNSAAMLSMAAVYMAPVVWLTGGEAVFVAGWVPLLGVAGLAILSTAVAYLLYFHILAAAGATNLLLVTFLIPASALALGALFLDETVASTSLLGLAVIFAGLLLIDGRVVRVASRRRTARQAASR